MIQTKILLNVVNWIISFLVRVYESANYLGIKLIAVRTRILRTVLQTFVRDKENKN